MAEVNADISDWLVIVVGQRPQRLKDIELRSFAVHARNAVTDSGGNSLDGFHHECANTEMRVVFVIRIC